MNNDDLKQVLKGKPLVNIRYEQATHYSVRLSREQFLELLDLGIPKGAVITLQGLVWHLGDSMEINWTERK